MGRDGTVIGPEPVLCWEGSDRHRLVGGGLGSTESGRTALSRPCGATSRLPPQLVLVGFFHPCWPSAVHVHAIAFPEIRG